MDLLHKEIYVKSRLIQCKTLPVSQSQDQKRFEEIIFAGNTLCKSKQDYTSDLVNKYLLSVWAHVKPFYIID